MKETPKDTRAWLFKGTDSQIFEGDEVAKKRKEGWFDSPDDAKAAAVEKSTASATSGATTKQIPGN